MILRRQLLRSLRPLLRPFFYMTSVITTNLPLLLSTFEALILPLLHRPRGPNSSSQTTANHYFLVPRLLMDIFFLTHSKATLKPSALDLLPPPYQLGLRLVRLMRLRLLVKAMSALVLTVDIWLVVQVLRMIVWFGTHRVRWWKHKMNEASCWRLWRYFRTRVERAFASGTLGSI